MNTLSDMRHSHLDTHTASFKGDVKPKIIVVLGPTATGKTEASIELALKLKTHNITAEIINADSMQVYKGFDVGTAKPTLDQMQRVRHHLLGTVPPTQMYNASQYVHTAQSLIAEIHANNVLPIIVGGTNLYIEGLLWPSILDMRLQNSETTDAYHGKSVVQLYDELMKLDPQRAAMLHCNDRKRITRSLDVIKTSGMKHSDLIAVRLSEKQEAGSKYDSILFAMHCDPTEHRKRIKRRCHKMIEDGIVDECKELINLIETNAIDKHKGICQSIGYKELIPIIRDTIGNNADIDEQTKELCIEKLEIATWQYARRQRTWITNRFKKSQITRVIAIDTTDVALWNDKVIGTMEREVLMWYNAKEN
ncbi:tRNA dimethylallyltransferase [Babesia bovis T2Bo]|uniref:tRNA dimethylallyltransferase n=1 Tax=Babesia bovis T2Bo TaxID=484906 RepID=UPI001E10E731|nr:tRNA dimethylallyltransferase [Babesia bovis T2Bo]EDO06991.2 tRNA dimethylallyltransferase [Babesia bovis T2Bo]